MVAVFNALHEPNVVGFAQRASQGIQYALPDLIRPIPFCSCFGLYREIDIVPAEHPLTGAGNITSGTVVFYKSRQIANVSHHITV